MSNPIGERPSSPMPGDNQAVWHTKTLDITIENSFSRSIVSKATPEAIFHDRVAHHAPFQELGALLSKMATVMERNFKITVAHAVSHEILQQIMSRMNSITENSLLQTIAHYPSDLLQAVARYPSSLLQEIAYYPKDLLKTLNDRPGDLVKVLSIHSKDVLRELSSDLPKEISRNPTVLLEAVNYFKRLEDHESVISNLIIKLRGKKIPLTHNSLHLAIIHKLPKEILKSILASVNPTRTSFILALVHGVDTEIIDSIRSRIQITDSVIAQIISSPLSPEALEGFLQSIPESLSSDVLEAILKKHKKIEETLEIMLHEENNLETAYKKNRVADTEEKILQRKTHPTFKNHEKINELLERTLRDSLKAITEDTLVFAIRYGNSDKIISILLKKLHVEGIPLTINSLHAAIECKIDDRFIKYFAACVDPTEYSFILALKNEAEFSILLQIATRITITEETLIHIFALPLKPEILASIIEYLKGPFSIKIFEAALRQRKDENILSNILDKTEISIDVLTLALKYKAPDVILIPLANAFSANPQQVLDLAIRYKVPSVISHMKAKTATVNSSKAIVLKP